MKRFKKLVITSLIGVLLSTSPMSALAAYSGTKAANYAKKHARNYNSSFPKFVNDCTNFVSQCVYYGGISMKYVPASNIKYKHINDIYKTRNYWSTAKYTRTTKVAGFKIYSKTGFVTTSTWSVVAKNTNDSWWGFYNYMRDRGAYTREYKVNTESRLNTFIKDCSVGDVLQVRSSTSSNKNHSVIVTDKSYDSKNKRYNMKIAYHTNDTAPTDFRNVSLRRFGEETLWTIIKVSKI